MNGPLAIAILFAGFHELISFRSADSFEIHEYCILDVVLMLKLKKLCKLKKILESPGKNSENNHCN